MKETQPAAASLLAVRQSVQSSLDLAEVLNIASAERRQAVRVFLQVDPSDPMYKYHSGGIIETLENLNKEFVEEKRTLDADWAETKKTYEDSIASLNKKMDENSKAMDQLEEGSERLKGEIAEARESLVGAEGMLKDDELYIKDLTERCEIRAKDWDQRSQLRADELAALTNALAILTSEVAGRDEAVNGRALLLQQRSAGKARNATAAVEGKSEHAKQGAEKDGAKLAGVAAHGAPLSFLQGASVSVAAASRGQLRGGLSLAARNSKVAELLGKEGQRLDSTVLSQLAISLLADPFAKVKTLIQQLVERLLAEATAEATKKGFCDEQLARARKDRDYRRMDTEKLDVEIQGLEIKLMELETEIEELTGAIAELRENLKRATEEREADHEQNLETMKEAKAGEAAVANAIFTLKVFYKQAAKAASFAQISPVNEDTAGAGFEGAYQGKQESSKGIIGLLDVIKSDFDRTYKTTEAAEQKAHEEFVECDRASRADIGGKETKKALDEEDEERTTNKIASKMEDLKTNQDLLDDALEKIADLKPTCIDTGMSYEERVAKREEEMEALKKALCILDAEGVEPDCVGEPALQ
mmetsp:Transcript_82008/g.230805  ORF Transcript_82008/g.230805 Transcript_82008/m.230805 type:complete len:588 (+) Transcript_82008:200-1963(+)